MVRCVGFAGHGVVREDSGEKGGGEGLCRVRGRWRQADPSFSFFPFPLPLLFVVLLLLLTLLLPGPSAKKVQGNLTLEPSSSSLTFVFFLLKYTLLSSEKLLMNFVLSFHLSLFCFVIYILFLFEFMLLNL